MRSFLTVLAAGFFGAVSLAAQQPPDQSAADQQADTQKSDKSQEYLGPTILGTDKSLLAERGGKLLDFRFWGQLTGVYDSGLTPLITNTSGNLLDVGGNFGVETGFGAMGSRKWKRDQLSLEYSGNYRHYANNSYFDGIDQFLNLAYGHVVSRRVTLDLKETVGTSSLANGAYTYVALTNTDLFAVPTNELFDNRTNFLQSRVDLNWQKTARLSFSFGGEGYLVRRRSLSLAGLDGYAAHATASYRLTRKQTVGVSYVYAYYDYQRTFGNSTINAATFNYAFAASHRWEFATQLGASAVSTLGLQQISLDPAIAAIVGQNTAITQFDRTTVIPYAALRLLHRFERSSATLYGSTGVSPGNGVFLTSRENVAGFSYSYTGLRRLTAGASAAYSELSTLGQTLGKYTNYQAGIGTTYKIANATHLEFRYDYRHYTTQNDHFKKDSQRISLGVAFSPGDKPLPIW